MSTEPFNNYLENSDRVIYKSFQSSSRDHVDSGPQSTAISSQPLLTGNRTSSDSFGRSGHGSFSSQRDSFLVPNEIKRFLNPKILANGWVKLLEKMKLCKKEKQKGIFAYEFWIECHGLKWRIYKRARDFDILEKSLMHEIQMKYSFATTKGETQKELTNVTTFRLNMIESGLQSLAKSEEICHTKSFRAFCEVSDQTFDLQNITRYKEGWIKKRSGGRFKHEKKCFLCYCGKMCRRYTNKWLIVTSEYVCYLKTPRDTEVHEIMLIDSNFKVLHQQVDSLVIQNGSRKLKIICNDQVEKKMWVDAIDKAIESSPWGPDKARMNDSFAPIRMNCQCEYFVDGHDYFERLYHELTNNVQSEVFITDWWLSPQLYLKRPASVISPEVEEHYYNYRLDKILQKLALDGKKVYILLYKEVEKALKINSIYTKKILQRLSPNIKVIRHPLKMIHLWSHHEKMVIIDQRTAFLGGIDLCYGRYDTHSHPLVDLPDQEDPSQKVTFPGIDYSNCRVNDFKYVDKYDMALVNRQTVPRMPWHDVHMMVRGEAAKDLARHFIEYYNHAKIDNEGTTSKKKGEILRIKNNDQQNKNFNNDYDTQTESEYGDNTTRVFNFDSIQARPQSVQPATKEIGKLNQLPTINEDEGEESPRGSVSGIIEEKKQGDVRSSSEDDFSRHRDSLNFPQSTTGRLSGKSFDFDGPTKNERQKSQYRAGSGKKSYSPLHRKSENSIMSEQLLQNQKSTKNKSNSVMFTKSPVYYLQYQEDIPEDQDSDEDFIPVDCGMPISEIKEMKKFVDDKIQKNKDSYLKWAFGFMSNRKNWTERDERQYYIKRFLNKNVDKETINMIKEEEAEDHETEAEMHLYDSIPKYQIAPLKPPKKGTCKCQILRSASSWSTGLQETEQSIRKAYTALITKAEKFIYIENQFFISNCNGDKKELVQNNIAQALKDRIIEASKKGQNFKVIIVLPLMPGFEGDVADDNQAAVVRCQLRLMQNTICRGKNNLIDLLIEEGVDISRYIGFYGLRTNDVLNGRPVENMIYVHSKVMIVDDKYAIIGSANINDRSMRGFRDSEIACLIEDDEKVQIQMGGEPYQASKFAHNLRVTLFKEHFGTTNYEDVKDPISDEFWLQWNNRAYSNTCFYREVFSAEPDDTFDTYKSLVKARKKQEQIRDEDLLNTYNSRKDEVQGHIVEYPMMFLKNESLKLQVTDIENFVPDKSFT